MATKRKTTTTRRPAAAAKKATNWGEKALAYLIVAIVVYGCFIYNPNQDPLDGMSYSERLRAEREAKRDNYDIYDHRRNRSEAYNRYNKRGTDYAGRKERNRSRYRASTYRR